MPPGILEPIQPVRLIWKVTNRVAVRVALRSLHCVRPDFAQPGHYLWMHEHEAAALALDKGLYEIPKGAVLGRISFPSPPTLMMRFRAPDRAISAALFFPPRFRRYAVLDRVRILNRLVTAQEAEAGADSLDRLLDRNVTVVDPVDRIRRLNALLEQPATQAERIAIYERYMLDERRRDVPEVEDYPVSWDGEDGEQIHTANSLRLRMVRAVERWLGKPTTISGIIQRTLDPDPSSMVLRTEAN